MGMIISSHRLREQGSDILGDNYHPKTWKHQQSKWKPGLLTQNYCKIKIKKHTNYTMVSHLSRL